MNAFTTALVMIVMVIAIVIIVMIAVIVNICHGNGYCQCHRQFLWKEEELVSYKTVHLFLCLPNLGT